jgi:tetratricopeptide (TPR) repeat protein
LEPALDSAGKLIEKHRRYVELLRVLADPTVRSVTLITARERLREPSIMVQHYQLRSLDVTAWETYFKSRNIATDGEALSALHNAYGGNAKAMDILSGAIAEDFSGDIAEYWRVNQDDLLIERDLEDLVTTQFNRIKELDGDAYNLLCRMGCYRYQDVPRVPIEGLLCLLWDVDEGRKRRVVKALQDRSLVDCADGEYWLHPVIRGEAIGRLKAIEDWQKSNENCALFWSQSVSAIEVIDDAIQAFEAYYHYVAFGSFDAAASVILQHRKSGCSKKSDIQDTSGLGSSFIRLGIPLQIFHATLQISQQITSSYSLSRLYNLLGDLFWIQGLINKAIECHQKSGQLAKDTIELQLYLGEDRQTYNNPSFFSIVYLFNVGICIIDLGDFYTAIDYLEQARLLAQQNNLGSIEIRACGNLAALYSYVGKQDAAKKYVRELESFTNFPTQKLGIRSSGYKLFRLGETYKNLGDNELAFEEYKKSIDYAEEIGFVQLKGIAMFGLADLYRNLERFEEAVSHHIQSIELLDKVGAKPDLAEAHYRLGLTYQLMGESRKGKESFEEAIQLFTRMEAPKQVERVRRSMENYNVL